MNTYLTRVVVVFAAALSVFAIPTTAAAAAPANDDFADATPLVGDAGRVAGSTVGATNEAGEPCTAGYCGPGVWYSWTSPTVDSTLVLFDLCFSDFDTTIEVFSGSSVTALSPVAQNDNSCGSLSEVAFIAVPGTVYYLRVAGLDGGTGEFNLDHPAGGIIASDSIAPVVSVPASVFAVATSASGASVSWTSVSAVDAVDGAVTPICTPANGSVFPLGMSVVGCTAQDAAGNIAVMQYFPVYVTYTWSDVLAPLNVDGDSIYKLGSTVPVRFRLTGYSVGITDATARIYLAKYTSSVLGDDVEATSKVAATSGNLFRYADGTYTFNLGTKGLSRGTWRARIDLGDGVLRTVDFSLR